MSIDVPLWHQQGIQTEWRSKESKLLAMILLPIGLILEAHLHPNQPH